MLKCILFDFDGTLANSLPMYLKAYDLTLRKYGIILKEKQIVDTCFGKTEETICRSIGIQEKSNEFTDIYFSNVRSIMKTVKLFAETIPTLALLRERGLKIGIATFAYRWYIDEIVKLVKINGYLDSILGFDDVRKPKPDPEIIIRSCRNIGVKTNEALVVGDTTNDILMGNNAGSKTALFLPEDNKRFYNFSILKKVEPTFIINKLSELEENI